MQSKFLLISLLIYSFSVRVYAEDIKKISFELNSIKLTDNIWGMGNANLKILILSENKYGETSVLNVNNENIQANLSEEIAINSGMTIPINDNYIAEATIIILNENDNVELFSLVLKVITNITKRKTIKELKKISKSNWVSIVTSGVLEISTDFAEEKIIEYIKENEICRTTIQIEKGQNNWSHNETISDENVRIFYSTNFVGYKKEEEKSAWDKGIDTIKEVGSYVEQLVQHNTTVIGNLMWQDEEYTEEEIQAYKENKIYGKALTRKNAIKYCKKLDLAGYTDWRLPSIDELQKLYDKKSELDYVETDILASGYWSNEIQFLTGIPTIFNFHKYLPISGATGDATYFVRCVRVK